MGTPCEISLYANSIAEGEDWAGIARAEIERLEQKYSRYRADSWLSRINAIASVGGAIEVDEETASLLDYADECHNISQGLFDITSGILRKAWPKDGTTLPSAGMLAELVARIGWSRIQWNRPSLTIPPHTELDFGGIVKEYAADRAAGLCRSSGARDGVINLGGDLHIIGPHPDGTPWHVGVRHPRRKDETFSVIQVPRGGVATSGDYERCLQVEGQRYCHILNPRTGYPVRHLASVTVVAPMCLLAGSASTVAMLLEDRGVAWLARLGLPHLWIDSEGAAGGSLLPSATAPVPERAGSTLVERP